MDFFRDLLNTDIEQCIYGEDLQKELAITKESVQEIQLQLKELDEYEKQLWARR